MPELVFFRRGDEVLRISLDRPRLVLGRGESSDVVLPDIEVSRQQVALVQEGERVFARDLSCAGTLVSGQRVEAAALQDGPDLQLGQWRAVYRARASADLDGETQADGTRTEVQPSSPSTEMVAAQLRVRRGAQETVFRVS